MILTFLLACGGDPLVAATEGPLPAASLYHLDVSLVDAAGAPTSIGVHRGHPVVMSMFYANCPSACPMLIEDVRRFEGKLSPDQLQEVRVMLVSLDPERDTPEVLARTVNDRQLDPLRWTLVRPAPDDVREIAAALGVRYRPAGDGEMNHSSRLVLLDADGVPVAEHEGLGGEATTLLVALERLGER